MPDTSARTVASTGERSCVFAKALLAHQATCELAQFRAVGERMLVECGSSHARSHCAQFLALLRDNARFALHLQDDSKPLTHMQALRLQCGGIKALQAHLASADTDAHRLVGYAQSRQDDLSALPWSALMPALAAWKPPRRGRPPR